MFAVLVVTFASFAVIVLRDHTREAFMYGFLLPSPVIILVFVAIALTSARRKRSIPG